MHQSNQKKMESLKDKFQLVHNPAENHLIEVFSDNGFTIPNSIEGVMLYLCWQRESPNSEQSKYSNQPAAPARSLRKKYGCVYVKGNRRDYCYSNGAGIPCRYIERINPDTVIKEFPFKISKINRKLFLGSELDFVSGSKCTHIDHRMPMSIYRLLKIEPPELTDKNIQNGTAYIHFQPLNEKTNYVKRERCKRCQSDGDIIIPSAQLDRGYKQRWEQQVSSTEPCLGCFWYDYLRPYRKLI